MNRYRSNQASKFEMNRLNIGFINK